MCVVPATFAEYQSCNDWTCPAAERAHVHLKHTSNLIEMTSSLLVAQKKTELGRGLASYASTDPSGKVEEQWFKAVQGEASGLVPQRCTHTSTLGLLGYTLSCHLPGVGRTRTGTDLSCTALAYQFGTNPATTSAA